MRRLTQLLVCVLALASAITSIPAYAGNDESGEAFEAPRSSSAAAPPRSQAAQQGTQSFRSPLDCDELKAIKRRGYIRAGLSNQTFPFGFIDNRNAWVGFDRDMLEAVARRYGVRLKLTVVNNRTRMSFLQGGHLDLVAASMTHKIAREKYIDFTNTYFREGQKFLVPRGRHRSVSELTHLKIGTLHGTTSQVNLQRAMPSTRILAYDGMTALFEALRSGRVSAISTDASLLIGMANKTPGRYEIIGDFLSSEPYGMGVQKGSCLREAVNLALDDIWNSGEYMKIYNKWFGPDSPCPFPLTVQWEQGRGFPGQYP